METEQLSFVHAWGDDQLRQKYPFIQKISKQQSEWLDLTPSQIKLEELEDFPYSIFSALYANILSYGPRGNEVLEFSELLKHNLSQNRVAWLGSAIGLLPLDSDLGELTDELADYRKRNHVRWNDFAFTGMHKLLVHTSLSIKSFAHEQRQILLFEDLLLAFLMISSRDKSQLGGNAAALQGGVIVAVNRFIESQK